MARQLGVWRTVRPLVGPSWLGAPLRRIAGLVIVTAGPAVLALLVMRNFQVLEEDAVGTFWVSAPGYALAHCDLCQRQRVIPERDADGSAPKCSGGRLFHRHRETTMDCFVSGSTGFPVPAPVRHAR